MQALSVEAAEPMAVEITEQETENATAVMTEEPKAEVDAEEIAEPAFVSVQILEEPLPEILEPVPVEPVKKTVRKKSGNTRKKNTAKTAGREAMCILGDCASFLMRETCGRLCSGLNIKTYGAMHGFSGQ